MRHRHSTTKAPVSRQPATTGPDVLYNGSDFDAYADGRYLCSRASSQDAWVEARRVHFDAVEAAAEAPALEAACDDLDAYAHEWDAMALASYAAAWDSTPAVQVVAPARYTLNALPCDIYYIVEVARSTELAPHGERGTVVARAATIRELLAHVPETARMCKVYPAQGMTWNALALPVLNEEVL